MRVAWDSAPDRPFTDSRACGGPNNLPPCVSRSQPGPRALSSPVLNRPQSGLYSSRNRSCSGNRKNACDFR